MSYRPLVPAAALALLLAAACPAAEKTAEEAFKNIKILKTLPQSEFLDAMRYMSAALGVGCDACHVSKDGHLQADLDDKKSKRTARQMIEMTMAINKESFEGRQEVGCATCHHGNAEPDRFPPIELGAHAQRHRMEQPPSGVTAADVVSKYVGQLGGEAAVQKLATFVAKGTLQREMGPPAPVEVVRRAPDKYLVAVQMPNGQMTQVYDGTEGWMSMPGFTRQADGLELDRLKRDAEFLPALDIQKQYQSVRVAGVDKIGDRKAYVLMGRGPGSFARFYFDADTGLLLRRFAVHRTAVGDMPEQTDFDDYRPVDGVKVPFTITRQEVGARWTERYENVTFGASVDESRFQKPPAPAGH